MLHEIHESAVRGDPGGTTVPARVLTEDRGRALVFIEGAGTHVQQGDVVTVDTDALKTPPRSVGGPLLEEGQPLMPDRLRVRVESFGFLHGVPPIPASALLVDLREQLRDPHTDPALRELTGRDPKVRHKVLTTPGAATVLEETAARAVTLFHGDPQSRMVHVLIGCQGGRHRSVVIAEEVAAQLTEHGIRAEAHHHHIDRPVVKR